MGKIEAIVVKLTKDYLRLPYALRRKASLWGLKPTHKHCAYNPTLQSWESNDL